MSVKKFIQSVREEKEGFSFDRPWRLDKNSLGVILPILRKSKKKRDYITFAEAQKIKVEDTGQIDHVFVQNNEDKPVYVSRGEIFRGKTQERAAVHGYIIMPEQGVRVAVRCVHQTKGIQAKASMEYGGRAPYSIDLSSQHKAWESVTAYACQVSGHTGIGNPSPGNPFDIGSIMGGVRGSNTLGGHTLLKKSGPYMDYTSSGVVPDMASFSMPVADDLVNTISDLSTSIKEVMKQIPFIKDQVGAIFFKENALVGMDVYDLPASWDSVKKDVVAKEGSNFISKDGEDMFEFKPEKANALAKKKLSADFEEKVIYDKEYSVIELRSEEALGEAIIFKDQVIHLTLWKKN